MNNFMTLHKRTPIKILENKTDNTADNSLKTFNVTENFSYLRNPYNNISHNPKLPTKDINTVIQNVKNSWNIPSNKSTNTSDTDTYSINVIKGSCCLCGTVKNCRMYLNKVYQNMLQIGKLFTDFHIIFFYDNSSDGSISLLRQFSKNNRVTLVVNQERTYPFRTYNLAKARNYCLDFVKKHNYDYFIMMDCDNVNCKKCMASKLIKYFKPNMIDKWDGLSFNTHPQYYDVWALSIPPFTFSYNHFNNRTSSHRNMIKCVTTELRKLKNTSELLPVMSAFNGFGIYKTKKFSHRNVYYDGSVRLDLITKQALHIQKKITRTKDIIYKKFPKWEGTEVNGKFEDCEHRAFHILAMVNTDAKIRISPDVIFA